MVTEVQTKTLNHKGGKIKGPRPMRADSVVSVQHMWKNSTGNTAELFMRKEKCPLSP